MGRRRDRALQDCELLSARRVLQHECMGRPEGCADGMQDD